MANSKKSHLLELLLYIYTVHIGENKPAEVSALEHKHCETISDLHFTALTSLLSCHRWKYSSSVILELEMHSVFASGYIRYECLSMSWHIWV